MTEKDANRIYDKFTPEQRNMTRTDFVREVMDLTSQAGIQRDLQDIELIKARERTNRIRIDKKLSN